MTRTALERFGKTLLASGEVVLEATANRMAVSRVLAPFVARVIIANPLQVKVIAQAHAGCDPVYVRRAEQFGIGGVSPH
jgi:transposase